MSRRRRLTGLLAVPAIFGVGLLLASCGSDDGDGAAPTITFTTETSTAETTTTEKPPPPAGPNVVKITVVNGAPKDGIVREAVEKGDRVVLVVTSDVTDHIHLHGYDVIRDVVPGRPARLPFKATIPGRFEVELEDRGVPIADITVTT